MRQKVVATEEAQKNEVVKDPLVIPLEGEGLPAPQVTHKIFSQDTDSDHLVGLFVGLGGLDSR